MKAFNSSKVANSRFRLLGLIAVCLGVVTWLHYDVPEEAAKRKTDLASVMKACSGRFIYMYTLPPHFNKGIVDQCNPAVNGEAFCQALDQQWGLGDIMTSKNPVYGTVRHWRTTHHDAAERLVHRRMQHHLCLTNDPALAELFYVPFYPGLLFENVREMPLEQREETYKDLGRWLADQPTFQRYGGADHFMVAGIPTWSLNRLINFDSEFGVAFESMPEIKNMRLLHVSRNMFRQDNVTGIPMPTGFHPISSKQIHRWQATVRQVKRPYTFAVIIPHKNFSSSSNATRVRAATVEQCKKSPACNLLDCSDRICSQDELLDLWLSAKYAVEDMGAMGTRYMLDAMLAGAVPIVLNQYTMWLYPEHFPDPDSFTLYLPEEDIYEWTTVEARIAKVAESRYRALQFQVVQMLPTLIYTDPNHVVRTKDAVDVALDRVLQLWADKKKTMTAMQLLAESGLDVNADTATAAASTASSTTASTTEGTTDADSSSADSSSDVVTPAQ